MPFASGARFVFTADDVSVKHLIVKIKFACSKLYARYFMLNGTNRSSTLHIYQLPCSVKFRKFQEALFFISFRFKGKIGVYRLIRDARESLERGES